MSLMRATSDGAYRTMKRYIQQHREANGLLDNECIVNVEELGDEDDYSGCGLQEMNEDDDDDAATERLASLLKDAKAFVTSRGQILMDGCKSRIAVIQAHYVLLQVIGCCVYT